MSRRRRQKHNPGSLPKVRVEQPHDWGYRVNTKQVAEVAHRLGVRRDIDLRFVHEDEMHVHPIERFILALEGNGIAAQFIEALSHRRVCIMVDADVDRNMGDIEANANTFGKSIIHELEHAGEWEDHKKRKEMYEHPQRAEAKAERTSEELRYDYTLVEAAIVPA